ncbi:uncharacterized protein cubi_03689 [Cryptosporidium ubiquitum]|uniref:Uncharacterized protein n=1 Tax=Cryptosporidium ubiquitum TaxID=857276 RepID=A0A1J4MH81_9CRYT|nr:uncharacterized protein cubi_03689 [Cryptosporidium ubiquitum]OII72819.1 hypothetical protein cubi_03689 [Cryptosporidium ubiquitum]
MLCREDVHKRMLIRVINTGGSKNGTNNHLNDLEDCDSHAPFWFFPTGGKIVIKVHNGVDEVVNGTKEDSNGLAVGVCIPCI